MHGTSSHGDLGSLDRRQKLKSDSLGLGRKMGVPDPCVDRQKPSHSPESRFLSYEACSRHPACVVVHASEGLDVGTTLAQGHPLHFSTWQHSILLWYMALPLQRTWPIPFLEGGIQGGILLPSCSHSRYCQRWCFYCKISALG